MVSNDGKRTEKVQISQAGAKFIARREGEAAQYEVDENAVKDLRSAASDIKEPAPAPKK